MPIGTTTMILVSAGMQIFNSWQNSRQNKLLQAKREEYERAVRENNQKRMFQLLREGQELTLEIEKDNHELRLKNLQSDFDNLLQRIVYTATIREWPLRVMPIVMKNQALGNLLAKQEERVALHCIVTPSNSQIFNKSTFPQIEEELEEYCNEHWSVISSHPILFYSGAWKSNDAPTAIQVDSMRTALSNLPTLLITPYFRPTDHHLVFMVRIWGVGIQKDDIFGVSEIENENFQRIYSDEDDWLTDKCLKEELLEDVVPYLQCMIGYIADTYFLTATNVKPLLPSLLMNDSIHTDGMKYLITDMCNYYEKLFQQSEDEWKNNLFDKSITMSLFDCLFPLWGDIERKERVEQLLIHFCQCRTGLKFKTVEEAVENNIWILGDLDFICMLIDCVIKNKETEKYKALIQIKEMLQPINYDYSVLKLKNIKILQTMAINKNAVALYRLGELYEYGMGVEFDQDKAIAYYQASAKEGFFLAQIRIGKRTFISMGKEVTCFLKNMQVKQIDIEYAREVLGKNDVIEISTAVKQLSTTFMASKEKYSHPGFIYYLGLMMLKEKKDLKNAMALLQLASKMGYVKANEFI